MLSCSEHNKNQIDIDFKDPLHKLFWFFQENTLVSIWNYSIDIKSSIAHIGILTLEQFQWKGCGKELVNWIILDILDNKLIPQYRVKKTNIPSNKIALSLWFTPVLETTTLVIK